MGNERRSYSSVNHRIDHDQFEDVALVNYKEGVIKDFALSSTNPITPSGLVDVEIDEGGGGGLIEGLPIFYHCRKGYFDDKVGNLKANKSLEFAPWGFRVGDKVSCMFRENQPVAVLGHTETPVYYTGEAKAPWPCHDIIRLQWHRTIGTVGSPSGAEGTQDWWKNWFRYQATWHCLHFRASTQELWKDFDIAPSVNGEGVDLPHRARHIFGMKELRWGTIIWYSGDWLIVVGPIAYIFMVMSLGMPAPITGAMLVQAAVWTPEREEEWIAVGAQKEKEAGTGGGLWPHLYTEIPYPYMVSQSKLTDAITKKLVGVTAYTPKWIVSEFWVYDPRREATDPTTPNTPAG